MHDIDDGRFIFEGEDDAITTWLRPSRAPKQADPDSKLQSSALRPHHALLVNPGRALWPGMLDGTESLPALTTSTTGGSSRESILSDVRAAKPEPVTSAERLALNNLSIDDPISGPDVERILNDLEPLDLDDLLMSMDKLVNEFPAFALHMEKGSSGAPAFSPQDQVSDTNPKVLPWLASVEEPEGPLSVSDGSPEEHFSSRADTSTGAGHPEQVNPRHDPTTEATQGLGHLQLTEFGKVDPLTCCSTASEPDSIDSQNSLLSVTDYLIESNISSIGSYAVEKLFGPGIENALHSQQLEEVVENFVEELVALKLRAGGTSLQLTSLSGGTDPQGVGSFGSSSGGSSLKRKASGGGGGGSRSRRQRKDDDDGDNGDTSRRNGGGDGPPGNSNSSDPGKSRPLEFMCPYRLKDPIRFNVREWYDCATKVYICEEPGSKRNELNELRRHIKQRHSGPGILSQPYCSTCKEEFPSPTLLDEHARRRACVYRELPSSNDPLDGLSPEAERVLRSKQGRQGDSAICQYRQICRIALGDASDVSSPGYLPVIEHFELHDWHIKCLPQLRGAFLRKLPFQLESVVESLLETIQIHTVDVLGQCNNGALRTAEPHKRRKAGTRKTVGTSYVPDIQNATSASIQPSPVTDHMRVAPRPVAHQGSNLSGDIPISECSVQGPVWLPTDYFPSVDMPPSLSLSDTASSDIQQLAIHAGTNAPPVLGSAKSYPSVSEPGPPSLGSNPRLNFLPSVCPKMSATPDMWTDENTDTRFRTEDTLTSFDALLAANGMSQYPVPGAGKESVDHPPMMFEMGSEDMLGDTSLERLIPLEHGEY